MISNLALCSGVASARRQDQARGTLTVLPSTKSKVMRSSVTETAFTRGSTLTTVLIPCLNNSFQVGLDQSSDRHQLLSRESLVRGEVHRLQPELADHPLSLCVDVLRLVAVEAVEIDAIRPGDVLG